MRIFCAFLHEILEFSFFFRHAITVNITFVEIELGTHSKGGCCKNHNELEKQKVQQNIRHYFSALKINFDSAEATLLCFYFSANADDKFLKLIKQN